MKEFVDVRLTYTGECCLHLIYVRNAVLCSENSFAIRCCSSFFKYEESAIRVECMIKWTDQSCHNRKPIQNNTKYGYAVETVV